MAARRSKKGKSGKSPLDREQAIEVEPSIPLQLSESEKSDALSAGESVESTPVISSWADEPEDDDGDLDSGRPDWALSKPNTC